MCLTFQSLFLQKMHENDPWNNEEQLPREAPGRMLEARREFVFGEKFPQKCQLTLAQLREKNMLVHAQEVQLNGHSGDLYVQLKAP